MTGQKKRRERERALTHYYKNKASLQVKQQTKAAAAPEAVVSFVSPAARRSAVYRLKKRLNIPGLTNKLAATFRSACKRNPSDLLNRGFTYISPMKKKKVASAGKLFHVNPFKLFAQKRDKKTLQTRRLFSVAAAKIVEKYGSMEHSASLTLSKQRYEDELHSSDALYARKQNRKKKKIAAFFEEKAVFLPGQRSVKNSTTQPKKVLDRPIEVLYRMMVKEQPDVNVSVSTFYRHRPKHILPVDEAPLLQCLCEICLNPMKKIKDVLNNYMGEKIQDRSELINATLCQYKGNFASPACIFRKCQHCGVQKLRQQIQSSLDVTHTNWHFLEVEWQRWEKVETHIDLLTETGSLQDLIGELLRELEDLSRHDFTHRWQSSQYRALCKNIPEKHVIMTMDFAENYRCEKQDQPQSAYYNYGQVTIHPTVMFYSCPECGSSVTDSIVYLSDVLKHDAHFVNFTTLHAIDHLKEIGQFSNVEIFSDGCAGQYKSKIPFWYLSQLTDAAEPKIIRSYFGSRHGKSHCDPLGGLVKTAALRAVRGRRVTIKNAATMFEFCSNKLQLPVSSEEGCCHTKRSFVLVKTEDLQKRMAVVDLKTLPGTRRIHCLRPLDDCILATRTFSCFCVACLRGVVGECQNKTYVDNWEIVKLAKAKKRKQLQAPPISPQDDQSPSQNDQAGCTPSPPPQRDQADPTLPPPPEDVGHADPPPPPLDREEAFSNIHAQLLACVSFTQLRMTADRLTPTANQFALPTNRRHIGEQPVVVDDVARSLMPGDAP